MQSSGFLWKPVQLYCAFLHSLTENEARVIAPISIVIIVSAVPNPVRIPPRPPHSPIGSRHLFPAWYCRDSKAVIPVIRIGIRRRVLIQVYDIGCNRVFVGPSPAGNRDMYGHGLRCGRCGPANPGNLTVPLRIIYVIHTHRPSGHPEGNRDRVIRIRLASFTVTAVITSVFTRYS